MQLQLLILSVSFRYNLQLAIAMFQNSYQNGTYFQLYDPKISQDKVKTLYRQLNVQGNNKVFDKDLKTYVLEFTSPTAKICFPKEEKKDLYLIQQYLVFQVYFFPGMSWSMELVISDLTKTKRRIIMSPATQKIQIKPFFVKVPCHGFQEGVWNNFAVDLYSYIEAFKGQTYRSLDAIYLTGHFKLRRIYSTNTEPFENQGQNQSQEIKTVSFLPKNFYFPMGVPFVTRTNHYEGQYVEENTYEPTEPSTKNGSTFKPSKNKLSMPKTECIKTEKSIKQIQVKKSKVFLANTNGTQILNRMRKQQKYPDSDTSQGKTKEAKTAKSTQKYIKLKKNLTKTQQMPQKGKSSLEKNVDNGKQEKAKTKAKLNPWRTNNQNQVYSDASQLQISKHQEDRKSESAQTSMFKTKNRLANRFSDSKHKGFDRKSDNYSDSEYVELSQKFSTLTDGKFFKNQTQIQNQVESFIKNDQDQIEENIQMETNSMYSNSNKKQVLQQNSPVIHESICDSLDRPTAKKEVQQLGRASIYGFGDKLMRKFMGEIQRPYSPPLGERELTEDDDQANVNENEKEEVEVIYDQILNCYYNPKTHTYYQLKN